MKVRSRLLKEVYYFTRLSCGLPLFFIPKRGFNKKSAVLAVHYGSINLDFSLPGETNLIKTPAGVAHFLEHLLFKKPSGSIMQEFARYGGYYNAGTGYTRTSYFIICSDNFKENLDLLLKLVNQSYFTEQDVAKEKFIIEQEIRMYLDIPEIRVQHNLLNNLYHIHPVRYEIGGTEGSIKEISPTTLRQCYTTFYQPSNMVAVIVGDLDYQLVVRQIEDYFSKTTGLKHVRPTLGKHPRPEDSVSEGKDVFEKIQRRVISEPVEVKERRSDIGMAIARPRVLIGYKEQNLSLTGKSLIKQLLTTQILLDCLLGKGSWLYNQLYNEGIIDEDFDSSYECQKSYGITIIGGETDQPDILYERILKGIKHVQKKRFKQRDLGRIKRKYLGRFARFFDSPEQISGIFVYYYLNNLKVFNVPDYIKGIFLKDIEARLFNHLDESYHSVSIIRPISQSPNHPIS